MSTDIVFKDASLEVLRKRYFPRVPWGAEGPVRRRYLAKAAQEGQSVETVLEALALAEGFIAPGGRAVIGDARACLAALREREGQDGLIFGQGPEAVWCDLALGAPDGSGWQELIVRSEQAENLVALASNLGAVRFRKM